MRCFLFFIKIFGYLKENLGLVMYFMDVREVIMKKVIELMNDLLLLYGNLCVLYFLFKIFVKFVLFVLNKCCNWVLIFELDKVDLW